MRGAWVAKGAILLLFVMMLLTVMQPPVFAAKKSDTAILLTMGDDPSTSINVSWHTDENVSLVEYGLFGEPMRHIARGKVIPEPYAEGYRAIVKLTGLKPGSIYNYRVSLGKDLWSEIRAFKTAPKGPANFTFVVYGDQGITRNAYRTIDLVVKLNPDFILHLGDLANPCIPERFPNCDRTRQNQEIMRWLKIIHPISSIKQYMITWGNHEYPVDGVHLEDYSSRIPLPGNGKWYSFNYGNVHFVAVNTQENVTVGSEQYTWLEKDLEQASKNPEIVWKIVFMHKHIYASRTMQVRASSVPGLREILQPLFHKYGVDLVLQGHIHVYERTYPISSVDYGEEDRPSNSLNVYRDPKGQIYITSGGAGAMLFNFTNRLYPWSAFRASVHHVLQISIFTNGILHLRAIALNGTVFDEIRIIKSTNSTTQITQSAQTTPTGKNNEPITTTKSKTEKPCTTNTSSPTVKLLTSYRPKQQFYAPPQLYLLLAILAILMIVIAYIKLKKPTIQK